MSDVIQEIAEFFQEAGHAHHQAYIETDGADPDWPIWYAEYMVEKLNTLLNASFTKSELVYLLITMERDLASNAPGANWPQYYGRYLAERYL